MKKFKKVTALFLTIILIASCFSVTSFAATKDNVRQLGAEKDALYLSLGDSYSRGEGLSNKDKSYTSVQSFVTQIADATGYSYTSDNFGVTPDSGSFHPCNYNALTVEGVLAALKIVSENDYMKNMTDYQRMINQYGSSLASNIEQANLITIELGMSDILLEPSEKALQEMGIDSKYISRSAITMENIGPFVNKVTKYAWETFYRWKAQYPKLLKYIKDHNKNNAIVVIIGAFNPIGNTSISEDSLVRVGDVYTAITASMNVCYKQWASEYGFKYADISTIKSRAGEGKWDLFGDEFWENSINSTHLTKNAQDLVTAAVLNVLPEKDAQTISEKQYRAGLLKHIKNITLAYSAELSKTSTVTNLITQIKNSMIFKNK